MEYYYPFWRRVVFLALLVLIIAVAIVPAISKGTVNIRVATISTPNAIQHVYLRFSQVQLHTAGLPFTKGWASVTSGLPTLDLAASQGLPSTISAPIQSGRFDGVLLSISLATLDEGGITPRTICSSSCPQVEANVTISIPPNGFGDILIVLSPDYPALLSSPATLTLNVVNVRTA